MYETSGVEVELGNKSWSSGNLHLIDCVLSRARNNFAQTYSAHPPMHTFTKRGPFGGRIHRVKESEISGGAGDGGKKGREGRGSS